MNDEGARTSLIRLRSQPLRVDDVVAGETDSRQRIAVLLALVVGAIMVSLPHDGLLAHTAADDAFYYLAIARRAGEAHWPTFDGAHTTTGFHPLWFFVLVPFAKMIASPWTLLRVAIALSSALMIAASLSFGRLFKQVWGAEAGALGGVLLIASPGIARLGWMAMEAPLALLLLSLFLRELFADHSRSRWLGLLAGLTILARLDMAIVVAVALGWRSLITRKIKLQSAIITGVVAALVVAPYVAWNIVLTGHAMTISSATKAYVAKDIAMRAHGGRLTVGFAIDVFREITRVGPDILQLSPASLIAGPIALAGADHPSAADPARHGVVVVLLALITLVMGGVLALDRSPRPRERVTLRLSTDLVMVLAISSAVHAALACVFLIRQSGPWYWGLEAITIVALLTYATTRWRTASSVGLVATGAMLASMAMLVVGLLAGSASGRFADRASFASVMLQAGDVLETERADGELAGSCNAGTLGYFHPRVVNLDGLVSDWSLLDARRRGEMRSYLAREKIHWVVDCVPPDAMDRYAAQLDLLPSQIERKVEIAGPACTGFVWRVTP